MGTSPGGESGARAACARVIETGEPFTTEMYCPLGAQEHWWHATVVRQGDGFGSGSARRDGGAAGGAPGPGRRWLGPRTMRSACGRGAFRERFIGILGHDLRNPLNAISLSARGLRRRGPLRPRSRGCASASRRARTRMGNMISDILDLTRARLSGRLPLHLDAHAPATVCRQVVEELTAAYPDAPLLETRDEPRGHLGRGAAGAGGEQPGGQRAGARGPKVPVFVRACQQRGAAGAGGPQPGRAHPRGAAAPRSSIPSVQGRGRRDGAQQRAGPGACSSCGRSSRPTGARCRCARPRGGDDLHRPPAGTRSWRRPHRPAAAHAEPDAVASQRLAHRLDGVRGAQGEEGDLGVGAAAEVGPAEAEAEP